MLVRTKKVIDTYKGSSIPIGVIGEVEMQLPRIVDEPNLIVCIKFENTFDEYTDLIVTHDEFKEWFEKI